MSHDPCLFRSWRRYMKRLGFESVSIVKHPSDPDLVICSAYDPMESKGFCRPYTFDDIKCILRAADIFWRYIK